jgi:hypothetical protein
MTQNLKFMEGMKVLPILIPADIVDAATATAYVDLDKLNWATLALHWGAITCDVPTVTLECSTAASSNATEVAIGFQYRLSVAIDTDDSAAGTITTATSTGVALAATDDGKVLFVEVDPAAVAAVAADMRWVRAVITPAAAITACVVGAVCYGEPRYPGNAIPSAT